MLYIFDGPITDKSTVNTMHFDRSPGRHTHIDTRTHTHTHTHTHIDTYAEGKNTFNDFKFGIFIGHFPE